MEIKLRQVRHFSKEFKKEKMQSVTDKQVTVRELSKLYSVSETAICRWIKTYNTLPSQETIVVEKVIEELKTCRFKKIAALEGIIGKQQVEVFFLESVIACGSELLGEGL